jgi:4-amino-4-deoxy-L-arabinose transferase-like glycosyltransferase
LPRSARGDGGGTLSQPPLYYVYEAGAYRLGEGGGFFLRFYLMRFASALLMLVTATGAWLLAGEVFARERTLQLVAAAVAGLLPMVTFISSGVNPDAMLYALWSIAFWLGARILRRGLTMRDGFALCAVAGLAVAEKSSSLALLPAVLVALGLGWWRLRRDSVHTVPLRGRQVPSLVTVAAPLAVLAVLLGGWVVAAGASGAHLVNDLPSNPQIRPASLTSLHDLRQFVSYVWQYYLPPLPFMQPSPIVAGGGGKALYYTWIQEGWGAFGWLEVRWPLAVYRWFAALSAVLILGGAVSLARSAWRKRLDWGTVAFFSVAVACLLFILHWSDYSIWRVEGRGFIQGRYLFPLVALLGLIVAGAVSLLPRRRRALAVAFALAALLVFQLFSMGLVVERYFV